MMKTLRTLWAALLALVLGFAVQAQQQVNNFTVKTNLSVGGNVQTVTLNGYNVDAIVTNSAASVATVFAENLQSLLSEASPSVAKLAYVLNDDSSGDATRGTYRYDPTLTGPETATVFMAQDKLGNTASTGRWVRMSAGDNYQMSVDTLDDALAVSPAYLAAGINPTNSIKLTVKTRARKTLGSGGAKTYYYAATAPATTNLGTVIPYGSGYLLWDKEGDVTPEMFGAKVNDATSDLTAINNALAYLHEIGGGTLVFGPGQYDINGSIVLKYRTSLRGQLDARTSELATSASSSTNRLITSSTVIALQAGANQPMVVGEPTDGYVRQIDTWEDGSGPFPSPLQASSIKGITFIGNGFNQTKYNCDILVFRAKWNLTVEDCSFFYAAGYAARLMDINFLRWHRNQISGSYGSPASKGMFFWGSSDSMITDSWFGGTTGPNLWIAGGTSGKNLLANLLTYNAIRTNASQLITGVSSGVFTTATAHYLETGDPVRWVTDGTLPSGLTASGISWVVRLSTNTFGVNPVWMGATNGVYTNYTAGSGNLWVSVGPASGVYASDGAQANTWVNIRADQHSDEQIYLHGTQGDTFSGVYAGDGGGSYNGETNLPKFAIMLDGATQTRVEGIKSQGSHGGVIFTNGAAGNYVSLSAFLSSVTNPVVDNTVGQNNAWRWYDVNEGRQVFTGTTLLSNAAPTLSFTAGNGTSGARINVVGGTTANMLRLQNNSTTTHTFGTDGSIAATSATIPTVTANTALNSSGIVTFTGDTVLSNAAPVLTSHSSNGTSGLQLNETGSTGYLFRLMANFVRVFGFRYNGTLEIDANLPTIQLTSTNGASGGIINVLGADANNLVRFQTNGTTTHTFRPNGDIFLTGALDVGATDTTLSRQSAGVVALESVPVIDAAVGTLAYSGTTVNITAGKGVAQEDTLTCTNSFSLTFSSLNNKDAGYVTIWPAATNCTITLPSYGFGPSGSTLTVNGGTGNTNYTVLTWFNTVVGGTNRVSVNALNYYR